MSGRNMVHVEGLVKVYPGGTRAVDGVDLTVGEGEFVGFLGPNGAGKSTTLKVLSTLLKKTSGSVLVAGHDVDKDPMAVRRSIGYAMQEVGLDDLVSGREFLVMQGLLYRLPRREAERRAEELLELVGLSDAAERKVGSYSGGMRRRIDLISALMPSPPLLFLDEPTTGLDPQSRMAIWEHLERLNREGMTILLTTQTMEEADRLCKRLAIIDRGRIIEHGTPQDLKSQIGGDVIFLSIDSASEEDHQAQVAKAEVLAGERSYVLGTAIGDKGLSVQVQNGGSAAPDLLRAMYEGGVPVTELSVTSPTLDDVFLKLTGRQIRPGEEGGDGYDNMLRPWMGLSRR